MISQNTLTLKKHVIIHIFGCTSEQPLWHFIIRIATQRLENNNEKKTSLYHILLRTSDLFGEFWAPILTNWKRKLQDWDFVSFPCGILGFRFLTRNFYGSCCSGSAGGQQPSLGTGLLTRWEVG
jgi:hypothetical protein